jgi:hypothetical protein
VKTEKSVVGRGVEVGIDDVILGGAKTASKLPELGIAGSGGAEDFRRRSELIHPHMLGKVEEGLRLIIDLVGFDSEGIEDLWDNRFCMKALA